MGELFEEFKNDMLKSDLGDRMEIDFIDLMDDDVAGYDYMKAILDKGYKLPLTFINQVPAFAGAHDVTKICGRPRNLINQGGTLFIASTWQ